MRRFANSTNRDLRFESLENRHLLAGNVTAAVLAGNLEIDGDTAGNSIQVSQTTSGDWLVKGIGTKVNGQNSQIFSGAIDSVIARLGDGNDVLQFSKGTTSLGLSIDMGAGNDVVNGFNFTVNDILEIQLGDGRNTATLTNVNSGKTGFNSGSGNDIWTVVKCDLGTELEASLGLGNNVLILNSVKIGANDAQIEMGDGADVVSLANVFIDGDFDIDLGDGRNSFSAVNVKTTEDFDIDAGSGADTVAITNLDCGDNSFLDLGNGNDTLLVHNASFAGTASVSYEKTSTGTKTTQFNQVDAGSLEIAQPGSGRSFVTVNKLHTDEGLLIFTGSNNDVISVNNATVGGGIEIRGFDGSDVVSIANLTSLQTGSVDEIFSGIGGGHDVLSIVNYKGNQDLETGANGGTATVTLTKVNVGDNHLIVDASIDEPSKNNVVTAVDCTAELATFNDGSDTGGGTIIGAGNHFAKQVIDPNFTHRFGDLQHDVS